MKTPLVRLAAFLLPLLAVAQAPAPDLAVNAAATATPLNPTLPTLFIAGDSTASEYGPERAPRQGWGQQLQSFLDPAAWQVRNHAQAGRSSRSFIEQGWLDGIISVCTNSRMNWGEQLV